jgi:hypothetical protein
VQFAAEKVKAALHNIMNAENRDAADLAIDQFEAGYLNLNSTSATTRCPTMAQRSTCRVWRDVTVHLDYHISFQSALYTAASSRCSTGTRVEVCGDRQLVRLYHHGVLFAVHVGPLQREGERYGFSKAAACRCDNALSCLAIRDPYQGEPTGLPRIEKKKMHQRFRRTRETPFSRIQRYAGTR